MLRAFSRALDGFAADAMFAPHRSDHAAREIRRIDRRSRNRHGGFIQKLPTQSDLMQFPPRPSRKLESADMSLHVVDATSPALEEQTVRGQ